MEINKEINKLIHDRDHPGAESFDIETECCERVRASIIKKC
jgi:hypothetical protein